MEFVCQVTYRDCTGLVVPQVKYAQLNRLGRNIAGAYWPGDHRIYIDIDYQAWLPHLQVMSILVHEMSHYVYYNTTPTGYGSCDTERMAWHAQNSFMIYVGQPEETDYTWPERYGCL